MFMLITRGCQGLLVRTVQTSGAATKAKESSESFVASLAVMDQVRGLSLSKEGIPGTAADARFQRDVE